MIKFLLSKVFFKYDNFLPSSCPRPSPDAYQEIFSKHDFEALTQTQEYQPSPTKSPGKEL